MCGEDMEFEVSQGKSGSLQPQGEETEAAGWSQPWQKEEEATATLKEKTEKVEVKKVSVATAASTSQEEGGAFPVFLPPGRVDLRIPPDWFQKEHLENPVVCDVPAWQVDKIFGPEGKDILSIEQSTETLLQVQILDPNGMARITVFGAQENKELVEANIYCQRRWYQVDAEKEKLLKTLRFICSRHWQEIPRLPGLPFTNPDFSTK